MPSAENLELYQVINQARSDGLVVPLPRITLDPTYTAKNGWSRDEEIYGVPLEIYWGVKRAASTEYKDTAEIRTTIKAEDNFSSQLQVDQKTNEVTLQVYCGEHASHGFQVKNTLVGLIWSPVYGETIVPQPMLLFIPFTNKPEDVRKHYGHYYVEPSKDRAIYVPFALAKLGTAPKHIEMDLPIRPWPLEKLKGSVIRQALYNSARLTPNENRFWSSLIDNKDNNLDLKSKKAILAGLTEDDLRRV